MSTTSTGETETDREGPFPRYLSPSQITSLLMCGHKFRLERVDRVPSRPMWASVGGSAVHKITERLDREAYAQG